MTNCKLCKQEFEATHDPKFNEPVEKFCSVTCAKLFFKRKDAEQDEALKNWMHERNNAFRALGEPIPYPELEEGGRK